VDTVLSWPSCAPTSAKQPKSWASEESGNLGNMVERLNAGRRRVREDARSQCRGRRPRRDRGRAAHRARRRGGRAASLRALMRQVAEELGQWVDRHEESNAPANLAEILNEGRERARKAWEKRQALSSETQTAA
jgi:hypothetical protein